MAEVPPEQKQECGDLQGGLDPDRLRAEGAQDETGGQEAKAAACKKDRNPAGNIDTYTESLPTENRARPRDWFQWSYWLARGLFRR
jgi:hypothetical protein